MRTGSTDSQNNPLPLLQQQVTTQYDPNNDGQNIHLGFNATYIQIGQNNIRNVSATVGRAAAAGRPYAKKRAGEPAGHWRDRRAAALIVLHQLKGRQRVRSRTPRAADKVIDCSAFTMLTDCIRH
ncbi:hypothetical protein ACJ51O_35935 (plasmid) [Burkholderia pyrrocinia]|uniref:hypothetical protein n=1 Tax=Burkholderia pyrrocinia TaxID=60550 RepID=UPI0038B5C74F